MLSHLECHYLRRISMIRCGLAGGSARLGLSACLWIRMSLSLSYCSRPSLSVCLPAHLWIRMSLSHSYCSSGMSAALLPAMMMD